MYSELLYVDAGIYFSVHRIHSPKNHSRKPWNVSRLRYQHFVSESKLDKFISEPTRPQPILMTLQTLKRREGEACGPIPRTEALDT